MLLKVLVDQYVSIQEPKFLEGFPHPFLLEEGRLWVEGGRSGRDAHYLNVGDASRPLVLGRKGAVDIRVDDRNTSGRHAELIPPATPGEPWKVQDLGSTNGTLLNGVSLEANQPAALQDRDTLHFGPMASFVFLEATSFVSVLAKEAKRAPNQTAKTDRWSRDELQEAGVVAKPTPEPAPLTGLHLYCRGLDPIPLAPNATVSLGRSGDEVDIVLPDAKVSRRHAQIELRDGAIYLSDLGSANGVLVKGERLAPNTPTEIEQESVFRICDLLLSVKGELNDSVGAHTVRLPARKAERKLVRGDLSKIGLGKLLLGIESKQKTGRLEVQSESGSGAITFRAGLPWTAQTSEGATGATAVRNLLQIKSGAFSIDPNHRPTGASEIDDDFSKLLRG